MDLQRNTRNRKTFLPRCEVRIASVLLLAVCLVLVPLRVYATDWPQRFTSRYATVYSSSEDQLFSFTREIGSGLSYILESPRKDRLLTGKRVDRLVFEVMKILDIRAEDLHFSIYVFPTHKDLEQAYGAAMHDGLSPVAYYDHPKKSIVVSLDTVNDHILAHEIAHAIICAYFSTPPPAQTQEILAQYVDKHLGE